MTNEVEVIRALNEATKRAFRLDSAVRQAYAEDPRAAHILLTDHAEFPELTIQMAKRKVPLIPWAHFVARVRDLARS